MTMYVDGNPKTKKALKDLIKSGVYPRVFSAGLGEPTKNGREAVCGPQYPAPHAWYAQVEVRDGKIVKVVD